MPKFMSIMLINIFVICSCPQLRAQTDMPNPLADVKVGEWVLYEMPGGIQQRQTVISVDDKSVTIKMETIINGSVLSSIEQKMDRPDKDQPANSVMDGSTSYNGSVKVKDKQIPCSVFEVTANGRVSRTYMSNQIPVTGLIKSEIDGTVALQLIDYGAK